MHLSIMSGPPDGTECGGFEDFTHPFAVMGDSNHESYGGKFVTDGTRVTFGDEDDAAFAALVAGLSPMMNNPTTDPQDAETVQDTELCDTFTMGTGACGTEPEDRYAFVITMGGKTGDSDKGEEQAEAARFTVFDVIGGGGFHRGDSTVLDTVNYPKVLVGA